VKLYDFSVYAERREAQRDAERIEALKHNLNDPGVMDTFKQHVNDYLVLHADVLQRAS
jgi:hypothetical protein